MQHAKMVSDVVEGLQEVLHQEKSLTETPETISELNDHVANTVKNTHEHLETQL